MTVDIRVGDALAVLRDMPDESVHCVVTSPPYWGLRAYGGDPGMIGIEETFDKHLENLVAVFREVRRVLRKDGVLLLNYGDAYASSGGAGTQGHNGQMADRSIVQARSPRPTPGFKPKDLMMMPTSVATALRDDGWWLRSMIPQIKTNPVPESAKDRPTNAVEYWFLLTKHSHYFWDAEAVKEPVSGTANARTAKHNTAEARKQRANAGAAHTPTAERRGMRAYKTPHGTIHRKGREKVPGVTPKSVPFNEAGNKIKQNESFQAAMVDQPAMRNMRNWIMAPTKPFKGAHFATFSPQIIEPWVKAGTSEHGVCPDCGAPWERVVEKSYANPGNRTTNGPRSVERRHETAGFSQRLETRSATTGFRPSCACYDERYRAEHPEPRRTRKRRQRTAWAGRWKRVRARPGNPEWPTVPAVVLDPFGGAGTVGLVAERFGRDSILIEINPDYAEMARRRIEGDAPLFAQVPE